MFCICALMGIFSLKDQPGYVYNTGGLFNLVHSTPCYLFKDIIQGGRTSTQKNYNIEVVENLKRFDSVLISLGPKFLYPALDADYLLRGNMILVNTIYGYMETDISPGASFWIKKHPRYPQTQHDILEFEHLPHFEQLNMGW